MRIFVSPLVAGDQTIRGEEHHYIARVRRAAAGDTLELVDGAGARAQAIILAIGEAETQLRVGAVEAVQDLPPRIRALIPFIKGDRMDTCLEKLVETGVDEVVVYPAARAVVKLDGERRESRIAHYQASLMAAARQSGRAAVPTVTAASSLAAALDALPAGIRVVLDPSAERGDIPAGEDVTIISGPEGGFAPGELDALAAANFHSIGLGPRVLRAETAPVIAVALIRATTRS